MSRLCYTTTYNWRQLNREILACRRCPRLVHHREHVAATKRRQYRECTYWGRPVSGFGDLQAQLVIVGLAPAAHGANRTGRMFTGDSSGDWLYDALYRYGFANQGESTSRQDGLRLKGVFVTAAARCAPPKNKLLAEELDACRPFLINEMQLLGRVRVVLALGRVAFSTVLKLRVALNLPVLQPRPLFAHGHHVPLPEGGFLMTSYHPSRQNTQTGRLSRTMWYRIFEMARHLLDSPAGTHGA